MTGDLIQIIALTSFGNNYLKNGVIPNDFDSSNSAFQFCNKISFKEPISPLSSEETIVAQKPSDWFKHLKNDGCKYLRLYSVHSEYQSLAKDYKLDVFVNGGGNWLIEAVYSNYSNYWTSTWELTEHDNIKDNIWIVNYQMILKKHHTINIQADNNLIKEKLRQTLIEMEDFALKKNLWIWANHFENAKLNLDSLAPENNYYLTDLIPVDKYSLIARQIIFTAGLAWAFGGMGSWNDLCFDNNEDYLTYDKLSEQLYSAINEAIIAAINTY